MTNIQRAFLAFWGQFTNPTDGKPLPAFLDGYAGTPNAQGTAITAPPFPYVTFNFSRDDFLTDNIVVGRVWTRSTGFVQITGIMKQIEQAMPVTGRILTIDGGEGAIYLSRSTPFMQYQPIDDNMLKVGHISLIARSYVV